MNYKVKSISVFERQARKLIKKYPSLKDDLLTLVHGLKENPLQGIPIGRHCYKIRLAIQSKNQGKSGGARLITHLTVDDNTIFLLSIYDESTKETMPRKEIEGLLKLIP